MAIPTKTILIPYVDLAKQKTQLEVKLRDVKARLAKLEPQIIDSFVEEGVQSMNVSGYTVYLNRKLFGAAMDGDKETMYAALRAADDDGWSFLVSDNVNASQLAARIRECDLDDQNMPILPDNLKAAIKVSEVFRIGVRKAG